MNRLQFVSLLVTAGSSVVLVMLAWLQSNVRASRLETQLDSLSSRQAADVKDLRTQIQSSSEGVRSEIREVAAKQAADMLQVRESLDTIHHHLLTFYSITGKLEGRVDELSRR